MRRLFQSLLAGMLLALALLPAPAVAQPTIAATCQDSPLPSGALSRICIPGGAGWGGDLVVFVPGFSPTSGFRNLTLPDGTSLPDLVTGLGYAFATTNVGLAGDVRELLFAFPAAAGKAPRRTYLTGVSQGALVITQLAERPPVPINGALAICGPIGDYSSQIDYISDFRVLFDYFFPGVLPPSPVAIPPDLIANWESSYTTAVANAVQGNPSAATQLIAASQAATDTGTPELQATTTLSTTLDLLWYNVFATNGANTQFGGSPYDNQGRVYTGTLDDTGLNAGVARYSAVPAARAAVGVNDTLGRPTVPLVVLHTTADPIVPYRQAVLYGEKIEQNSARGYTLLTVERYGHCNLTSDEILGAFGTMIRQASEWRWMAYLPEVVRE